MNSNKETIQFKIDHIDPLGHGVHKHGGRITFISKTLPGETGTAEILKSKKGVHFARLLTVQSPSKKRITPTCPHFEVCPGCDFLHTDYETELSFKIAAIKKHFQKIDFDMAQLKVIRAPNRSGYRNRIQLHYRNNKLGLIDGLTNRIVEIPECQIVQKPLRPALKTLYKNHTWQKKHRDTGHCELYLRNNTLQLHWDAPYAYGGFSQVNDEMNVGLRNTVADILKGQNVHTLLDLFSGDGNLSNQIVKTHKARRIMVDTFTRSSCPEFIPINLFDPAAIKDFEKQCGITHFDIILVNPPRKGFPALAHWVAQFRPKTLILASCHPGTLVRDLTRLRGNFKIPGVVLVDLFPGTHHFETVVHIEYPNT